jgi:hypothetical protein
MEIKEVIEHLNDAMRTELNGVKVLKGKADETFRELFRVSSNSPIYYTKLNMIITDAELMQNMSHFLKSEDKVMSIEIPEYAVNLWVFSHFNNQVVSTYLPL